eukprot:TRINITY_DN84370_c0_g1_i1.p1 TRINITY_DN84370_c0_g1~~TRINITY_DN84370_c0_g1_i1.p1  ORF type:complete len:633 (-),score=35.59 TRINITY_DN84370_c0_g1_i1:106-1725(-)
MLKQGAFSGPVNQLSQDLELLKWVVSEEDSDGNMCKTAADCDDNDPCTKNICWTLEEGDPDDIDDDHSICKFEYIQNCAARLPGICAECGEAYCPTSKLCHPNCYSCQFMVEMEVSVPLPSDAETQEVTTIRVERDGVESDGICYESCPAHRKMHCDEEATCVDDCTQECGIPGKYFNDMLLDACSVIHETSPSQEAYCYREGRLYCPYNGRCSVDCSDCRGIFTPDYETWECTGPCTNKREGDSCDDGSDTAQKVCVSGQCKIPDPCYWKAPFESCQPPGEHYAVGYTCQPVAVGSNQLECYAGCKRFWCDEVTGYVDSCCADCLVWSAPDHDSCTCHKPKKNMIEKLLSHPDHTEFAQLVALVDRYFDGSFPFCGATILAPTNKAMKHIMGNKHGDIGQWLRRNLDFVVHLVNAHIIPGAHTIEELMEFEGRIDTEAQSGGEQLRVRFANLGNQDCALLDVNGQTKPRFSNFNSAPIVSRNHFLEEEGSYLHSIDGVLFPIDQYGQPCETNRDCVEPGTSCVNQGTGYGSWCWSVAE